MATSTTDPLAETETQYKPGEPPPEVKRDQWGRYLLPDPDSGKLQPWTRATTFAKSASDTFALALWQNRMVAKGMSMRPDLYALAAATHPDDKETLNRIAEQAKEAAGGSSAASLGTALHAFTEQEDRGEKPVVPEPWTDNVRAYNKCLVQQQLVIDPKFIETVVIVPQYGVAGTLDRLARLERMADLLRITDLKTGKDLTYGWMEIAVQLFLYSRATHWYDIPTKTLHEMPKVDQKTGLVIHLPVNQKTAALYEVDLELGAAVAQHIGPIREFRKRKDYARLVSPPIEAIAPVEITAEHDPEWDEPQAESAKIASSVLAGNTVDKAAKAGTRFAPEKNGKDWVVRDTELDRLVPDVDSTEGGPARFKLKRDAKAYIEVLTDKVKLGQKAAEDIKRIHKAEEWPEDAEETEPKKDAEEPKDLWMGPIFEAESYPELQALYRRGTKDGTWNDRHTKAAAIRKTELEEIEREIANAPTVAEETSEELADDDW
jgi:hypothetical protein